MKIAVTYEAGNVFQHFGHTTAFKVYEAEEGKILSSQVVETNGSGHGALAGLLEELGVQVLLCGGIGAGARFALEDADIQICGGVSGDADEAVESYLSGALDFNPHAACAHHHHHHDHGHDCHCGHHHDHEHEHDHDCGCGHHHEHEHHDHECGCGHHHD